MDRRKLIERDVREDFDPQQTKGFLEAYMRSNFPQTAGIPSKLQAMEEMMGSKSFMSMMRDTDKVKSIKPGGTGISYDDPGAS